MTDAIALSAAPVSERPPVRIAGQNAVSLALAGLVMGAWAMAHVIGVLFFPLDAPTSSVLGGRGRFLVVWWGNAGLLILGHVAMDGP
ncbi:MAG: hypothetical protein ACFB6R_02400, partial [Alphaproteobacteria bacterium]